jgi:hypothetical protein
VLLERQPSESVPELQEPRCIFHYHDSQWYLAMAQAALGHRRPTDPFTLPSSVRIADASKQEVMKTHSEEKSLHVYLRHKTVGTMFTGFGMTDALT